MNNQLYYLIEQGNLDKIKEYYYNQPINNSIDYTNSFFHACRFGHFKVAKWILEVNPEIINFDLEYNFQIACSSGNYELVKWLLEIKQDLISEWINKGNALANACDGGNLSIVKLVYESNPHISNAYYDYEKYFINACGLGHLEVAQWILELVKDWSHTKINISADNDKAINMAFSSGHTEVVKFLAEINPKYKLVFENDKLIDYEIIEN